MNKKIALCFYGQSRNVDRNYKSIYDNLIRENDVDVFIHTWKNFDYQRLIDLYEPISYRVETQMNFDYRKKLNTKYRTVFPQIYSVSKVRELKIQHELEIQKKYDIVIKMRPDISPLNKVKYDELNLNYINVCGDKHSDPPVVKPKANGVINDYYWFDDNFSISNTELFDQYYDWYDHADEYFTLENEALYNEPWPAFFGEGAALFFSVRNGVYTKIKKNHMLNFNLDGYFKPRD